MQIFNIFAAVVLLFFVIKVFLLLKNNESGDEKITKAVDLLIAILLVSVSWSIIYYIFGYETADKNSREVVDDYQKSNTSVVKFADDK